MYLSGFYDESICEGDGIRSVFFISGCKHNCKGCFSPKTHDFKYGKEFTKELQLEKINFMKQNTLLTGLTLCGGDPFYSAKDVIEFLQLTKKEIKRDDFDIWSYTGFRFEEILQGSDEYMKELLVNHIDVLIDGRFNEKELDLTLKFRGSRNQRIIDVKESLKNNKVILWNGGNY